MLRRCVCAYYVSWRIVFYMWRHETIPIEAPRESEVAWSSRFKASSLICGEEVLSTCLSQRRNIESPVFAIPPNNPPPWPDDHNCGHISSTGIEQPLSKHIPRKGAFQKSNSLVKRFYHGTRRKCEWSRWDLAILPQTWVSSGFWHLSGCFLEGSHISCHVHIAIIEFIYRVVYSWQTIVANVHVRGEPVMIWQNDNISSNMSGLMGSHSQPKRSKNQPTYNKKNAVVANKLSCQTI